jgi:hypothetical protein
MNDTILIQQLTATILAGHNPHWVHNAAITDDIEALRKICLYQAQWWNHTAWPALVAVYGDEETALTAFEDVKK